MKQGKKLWLKISIATAVLALVSVNSAAPLPAMAAEADTPEVTIEWTEVSPMSKARHSGATVVVDGIIYTIGGTESDGTYEFHGVEYPITTGTLVEAYDPESDTWTAKAPLPYPPDMPTSTSDGRQWPAAAAYQGKIYTFGGADLNDEVKDTVDVYDIATDTWTAAIANLPTPIVGMSAVTYGDKIYLFGGSSSTDFSVAEDYHGECYEFDPATTSFTARADMPNPRVKTSAIVYNDCILVFGGASGWGNRNAQIYDPATDSWSFSEPVTWERNSWFGAMVNDMVFLMGGRDEHITTSATVNVYNDQWDTWVEANNILNPREDAFVAGVDGKLYVMGGRDNEGNPSLPATSLASAEKGTPPSAPPEVSLTLPPTPSVILKWSFVAPMLTPRCYGATAVVDNTIYVIGGTESGTLTGKVLEAYDPVTDQWTSKAPLPEGRFNLAAAAYQDKIYIFGGVNIKLQVVDTIDVYDIATDTWQAAVATLPSPAAGISAVTYGDKIYLFGGSSSPQMFVGASYYYDEVYEFDPVALTFTSETPMPLAKNMALGCTLGDIIYIIGGTHSPGATGGEGFGPGGGGNGGNGNGGGGGGNGDGGGGSWGAIADMPDLRGGHSGTMMGGKIYITGGQSEDYTLEYENNFQYDPDTDQWQEATPNIISRTALYCATASAPMESMYVIGGIDSKGNILGSVEMGILSGAAPPATGTIDVSDIVTAEGIFAQEVIAKSVDEICELTIGENTQGFTIDNEPLTELSLLEMEAPPAPPEGAYTIGLVYDFGPDGATFTPSITLEFGYDPSLIPEGVAEEDLATNMWDETASEWVELGDCVVDPIKHTVTAPISHFTAFAILGYEAATPSDGGGMGCGSSSSSSLPGELLDASPFLLGAMWVALLVGRQWKRK